MPIPKPNTGESFDKFIERCMSDDNMVSEYSQEQRYAICSIIFSNKEKATNPKNEETFTDYPKAATENAKRALKWKEENGNKNDTRQSRSKYAWESWSYSQAPLDQNHTHRREIATGYAAAC
jgi:hypothetical protein